MNRYKDFEQLDRQSLKRHRDCSPIEETQSKIAKKQKLVVEGVCGGHVRGVVSVQGRALVRETILIEDDEELVLIRDDRESVFVGDDEELVLIEHDREPILIEDDKELILIEDDRKPTLIEHDREPILIKHDEELILIEDDEKLVLIKHDEDHEKDHSVSRKALPRQIEVIENNNNLIMKGTGCRYDPIMWLEWTIIHPSDNGACFDISDDDDEDHSRDYMTMGDDKDATTDPEYVHSQDGTTIGEAEPIEEALGLSFSQESAISDEIATPSSSRVSSPDWTNSGEDRRKHGPDLSLTQDTEEPKKTKGPYPSQKCTSKDLNERLDKESLVADGTLECLPEDFITTPEKPHNVQPGSQLAEEIESAKLLLAEKKRLFYFTWAPKNLSILRAKIAKFRQNHPETKKADECWLYTGPLTSIRGSISLTLHFRDDKPPYSKNSYSINVAYLSMIVDGFMTDEYKHGIIKHAWHASHLCGNWTCTNPRHIVAEAGSINSTRNSCFWGFAGTCVHSPPCMKHLRIEPQPGVVEYLQAQRLKDQEQKALEDGL